MLKVPALFFLTLLITFPSLYVFNALVGSRLTPAALLRLLIAALGVNLAILASFGPIVAFFSVTTTSYDFMGLLNVLFFAVAGALGLAFLLQTLQRLTIAHSRSQGDPGNESVGAPSGALGLRTTRDSECAGTECRAAGTIGRTSSRPQCENGLLLLDHRLRPGRTQLSWVLRPFIGDPDQPFQWFRPRQSNFFEAVWKAVHHLFT